MRKSIFIILALIISTFISANEKISNGIIEIRINTEKGTYDIYSLKDRRFIIKSSLVSFSVKPYVDLKDLGRIAVETDVPENNYTSAGSENSVREQPQLKSEFNGGRSISLLSSTHGVGELEVQFTLYPDSSFVETGFSFRNLGENAVRLSRVDVLDGLFFSGIDHEGMMILDGNSGAGRTDVRVSKETKTENNVLCLFPDIDSSASMVAGGMTYEDYRKWVEISGDTIVMYAADPVGKRVDPGSTYISGDSFYLNGIIDNPFEALEHYAWVSREARGIDLHYYTFPSVCMWFLSVTHFGADPTSENSSVGAVREMENIEKSGFLKYSPVAVRLVPDNYEQNNQQGWWDDEHWQKHGRKYRCVVDHHYREPYETTEKWAGKVKELGGIPLIYFQPGIRSEDYAAAFPGHMLYNESQKFVRQNKRPVSDPHSLMGIGGIPDLLNADDWIDGYGKLYAESYDYTDPEFLEHWKEVNENLREGGVEGVFYDYPDRAFPQRGGLEDRYATALEAYCNVFGIAREVMGPEAYLQERIGPGSDASLESVNSVRTEGDTNVINTRILNKAANRWYKNRLLTNYDMDGKALVETGYGEHRYEIGPVQRKSILTLSYAVSGRLLLTESFSKFSEDVLYDLSRIFPFHSTTLSPRPLHAFSGGMPVLDFPISDDWHQLILYNDSEEEAEFMVPLSGNPASGALGLDPSESYYLYDFWNDAYMGKVHGSGNICQEIQAGEARMLSVHSVKNHPQWISTNRHVLQGYVDMVDKPEWKEEGKTLSGVSSVIGGEPYNIVLALNGYTPVEVFSQCKEARISIRNDNPNLADLVIIAIENTDVEWEVVFE